MNAWLVYEKAGAERNSEFIKMHYAEGKKLGISFHLVIIEDGFPEQKPDFAIVRAMRPDVSKLLEAMGIPVFNNSHVSSVCNHKARTYEYLSENNIPVIPWISATQANSPPKIDKYPVVIKPCCGHGGQNVLLINHDAEYASARKLIAPDDYVIQPLATSIGRDMRVYIIGNKPIAAVLRESQGIDFRSNFSVGGKVSRATLSPSEAELVEKVCSVFDFAFCGIDIMYHNGVPVINEIEDVVGSRMLYKTHDDIDVVSMYLKYIFDKTTAK